MHGSVSGFNGHKTSRRVPHTAGHSHTKSQQSSAGATLRHGWEQGKLLSVKWNKTCLFYPFSLHAGLGDGGGSLLTQETTVTSNHEPHRTFDPFSSLRANPMLFLSWNQEISWLSSLSGQHQAQNLNPLQRLRAGEHGRSDVTMRRSISHWNKAGKSL